MDIGFKAQSKRPIRVGTVEAIDAQTGEVLEVRPNAMTLMPFPDGVCPECGRDHPHDEPHNQQSLGYQYRFYATHARWPTWTDAMAHCTDEVKSVWREHLIALMKSKAMTIPPDLLDPAPAGR